MKNNFFNQVINRVFADGEPTANRRRTDGESHRYATLEHRASCIVNRQSLHGSLPTVDRRSNYTSSTRHRVACILFVMLFAIPQMWGAVTNTSRQISTDGKTSTWSMVAGETTTLSEETTIDDIIYVPGTVKFTTSGVSVKGTASVYVPVPAGSAGSISMTVYSNSDSRYFELWVGSAAKGTNYRLWSKSGTDLTKKGPQSFTFTSSEITTKGGKTYLWLKDNNTEMKVSGFVVTLTTGSYTSSDPVDPTITFDDANYEIGSTLDLSTLFTSDNTTGTVTYAVKDAGTTGASITGSNFTATAVGTATVTASQAAVDGQFNAKDVDATITVKVAAVKYAVTFAPGEGASGEMDALQQAEGDVVTLPACTFNKPEGKVFKEWTSTDVTITDGKFTMPGNAVTITATWDKAPAIIKLIDNGQLNTTDFRHIVTSLTNENYTVNNISYTKCLTLGTTNSTMIGMYAQNKFVAYDTKTSSANVKIAVYNKNSGAKNLVILVVPEGANPSECVPETISVAKASGYEKNITTSGRTTIYCSVNSTNICFCQIEVAENGVALPKAGEVGYSVNHNLGRIAAEASNVAYLDGIEYVVSTSAKVLNTAETKIKTLGTNYVKFTNNEPVKLILSLNSTSSFYIGTEAKDSENGKKYAFTSADIKDGVFSYELPAGTWYINPANSEIKITKIAFAAATPIHHVTYAKGEATCEIALPTQDDVKEGASFKVADAIACEGLDFTGWNDGATTYDAGADYTMGTTDVTLTAQWKEHVTSTDATLKSLKVNDEEILDGDKVEYTIFAQTLPTVVATKNNYYATITPTEATAIPGDFVYVVTAESGAQKTYTLHVKSYDDATGVLMKGELTSNKAATVSGIFPGNAEVSVSTSQEGGGYKLGSNGQYIGLVPSEGSFKEGDIVIIEVTKTSAKLEVFSDKGSTMIASSDAVIVGENKLELTADASKIYLYRNSSDMNPYVKSVTVIRPVKHTVTYVKGATPEIIAKVSGDVPAPTQIAEEKVFQTASGDGLTHADNLIFAGWNDGETTYSAGADYTMGTVDVTFVAQWVHGFVVTYMDGTTQLGTEVVIEGNHPTASNINTNKPLYTFSHWENEGGETVELNTIDDDITLYGKWDIAFAQTIDFEANAGASSLDETFWTSKNYGMSSTTGVSWDNNSKYADKGLKIKNNGTKLEFYVPANKLMIFKVGSTSGAKFDGTALTQKTSNSDVNFSNVVYDYAAIDKKHTYQTTTGDWNILKSVIITDPFVITYNVPEGASCDKTEDTFIGQSLMAPDATMNGKIFLGWFDDETGGNLIATAGATLFPTEAMDLYAQFRDINVVAVSDFAVTPTDDPFSVSLSWNVPGMVDVSQAMAPYQATTDPTDANPILTVNADGSVNVTCQLGQYGNSGVGFPIASGVVKQISFEYKVDLPSSDCFVWGGAGVEAIKVNWQGKSTGRMFGDKAEWTLATCMMQENYWEGTKHSDADNQVAIYVNSDGTYTQSFSVRNIHYLIEGGESNDNQKVIVVRKADAASTSVDDGEKIYEGTNFSLQDNLTEAGTYYYTVYAVGPQNTYVASDPIKYEFAHVRSGLTNGKLVTMCQAKPVAKMWGGAAFDVEKKYSVGIVCLEANIEEQPLTAGKPYILFAEASEIYVLYGEGDEATEVVGANGLVGNLSTAGSNLPVDGDNSYIFQNNHFYLANSTNFVAPDRAYLNYSAVEDKSEPTAAPSRRRLSMGGIERGQATGWDEMMMNEGTTKFIRHNQMFILREGKLFNAQGAHVK